MFVIKYKWIFFLLSGLLVLGSIWSFYRHGLNLGTDFTGGSIVEVSYQSGRPTASAVRTAITPLDLGTPAIQLAGESEVIVRLRTLTESEHQALLGALPGDPVEGRFSSIGPSVGAELARKGLIALVLVILLIIAFIAFAFRQVSRPVSSWKYGVVAFIALLHDLIIPIGIFSYLGAARGYEVDALFLTGLLTILGLSIHDTIVVFDRIRENLRKQVASDFAGTVGQSLSETFSRSINTSLTIIFVLVVMFLYGAAATKGFTLLMAVGVLVGTYSSIFIASPLLVAWEQWSSRQKIK